MTTEMSLIGQRPKANNDIVNTINASEFSRDDSRENGQVEDPGSSSPLFVHKRHPKAPRDSSLPRGVDVGGEDHTIVIDLTEEKSNITRTPEHMKKEFYSPSASIRLDFSTNRPESNISWRSTTSSMVVQPPSNDDFSSLTPAASYQPSVTDVPHSQDESQDAPDGQHHHLHHEGHFLIDKMLNGKASVESSNESTKVLVHSQLSDETETNVTNTNSNDEISEGHSVVLNKDVEVLEEEEQQVARSTKLSQNSEETTIRTTSSSCLNTQRSRSLKRDDGRISIFDEISLLPTNASTFKSSTTTLSSTDRASYTSSSPSLPPASTAYRSLDRRLLRSGSRLAHFQLIQTPQSRSRSSRKAQSNDFLDRLDTTTTPSTLSIRSTSVDKQRKAKEKLKMTKIEKGLYLGNMEAATDVILLGAHAITHIVTLDSVPLPRKISASLPRISNLHLQVTDLPDEDILSVIGPAIVFVEQGISSGGNVLVHCFRGKSRSAAIVIAFLMQKYGLTLEKAFSKVKAKREIVKPNDGFMAQLKLFEVMDYQLDSSNVQFKMFKLHLSKERMRKARILYKDTLDLLLDDDPGASSVSGGKKSGHSVVFKCKKCRRTLATSFNLIPHVRGEPPEWSDTKWSLPAEEVLEGANDLGLQLCSQSVYVNPVKWMEPEIKQNLTGRLFCPNCQGRVGEFSWVSGSKCKSCKVTVVPAFQLDVTEIIFKTRNKYLYNTGREPVVV